VPRGASARAPRLHLDVEARREARHARGRHDGDGRVPRPRHRDRARPDPRAVRQRGVPGRAHAGLGLVPEPPRAASRGRGTVMRRSTVGFCAGVFLAAASRAGSPSSDWDRLRSLVGSWQGTNEGRPVSVTYTLVSNGTALMESLDGGHDANMITMYTPDGAVLLATHYCAAGNQPRMRARASADGKSLDFQFVDVANAAGSSEEVMQRRA